MKRLPILLLFLLLSTGARARTIEVRPGGAYTNLEPAAAAALPGDTILFRAGVYAGGQYVEDLQGTASGWITIMAATGEEVVLRGGGNAWQLSDPAWLRISGFVIERQTGNGLNIDDGGSLETPAHHLIIERCTWRGIDATGNNDQLKLSGLDSFTVRDCTFLDGAAGGSMIDMVGCHNGVFERNRFERAGSNSIQAKGGTQYIRIERNTFVEGGSRAVNIGGSTGLPFFRPPGVNFESADIHVYSNLFVGSEAPVAFVGTVRSEVVNNTFYLPRKWVMRILQETTGPEFLQCGDNVFRNNIVVLGNAAANPSVNIGSNTRPESFTFSHNLWYNVDNPAWSGPNLPAAETGGIRGRDPLLAAPPADIRPNASSPAIGAGYSVVGPMIDYLGRQFATPRSIGAVEGNSGTGVVAESPGTTLMIELLPNLDAVNTRFSMAGAGSVEMTLHDIRGELVRSYRDQLQAGDHHASLPLTGIPSGRYVCNLTVNRETVSRIIDIVR